jgi:hypothetical protein
MPTAAAREMLNGIPDSTEVVLADTGDMVGFTNPLAYTAAMGTFLRRRVDPAPVAPRPLRADRCPQFRRRLRRSGSEFCTGL